jgi:hypothetical protein
MRVEDTARATTGGFSDYVPIVLVACMYQLQFQKREMEKYDERSLGNVLVVSSNVLILNLVRNSFTILQYIYILFQL